MEEEPRSEVIAGLAILTGISKEILNGYDNAQLAALFEKVHGTPIRVVDDVAQSGGVGTPPTPSGGIAPSAPTVPGYSGVFIPEVGAYFYTELKPAPYQSPKTMWRSAVKPPVDKSRELNVPAIPPADLSGEASFLGGGGTYLPNQLQAGGYTLSALQGAVERQNPNTGRWERIDTTTGAVTELTPAPSANTKLTALEEFTKQFGEPTSDELAYMRAKEAGIPQRQPVDKSMTEAQRAQIALEYEKFGYSQTQDQITNELNQAKFGEGQRQFDTQQARLEEQAKLERDQQRLLERAKLLQDISNIQARAAFKAIPPSLVGKDIPGYQPGGPMEGIYKRLGLPGFTPQKITGVRPDVSGIEKALAELAR